MYAQLLVTCVSPHVIPGCDMYICFARACLVPGQYSVACMQHHQSRDRDPWSVFWGEVLN